MRLGCLFGFINIQLSFISWLGKGNDEEGKAKVSQIHEMKEELKQQNDTLKKLKQQLKDVQEKQKNGKEVRRNFLTLTVINLCSSVKKRTDLKYKLVEMYLMNIARFFVFQKLSKYCLFSGSEISNCCIEG